MLNDFFTKVETYDLVANGDQKIGTDTVTYQILKVVDTRNLTYSNTYAVTVRHRINVRGIGWDPTKNYQSTGFNTYPILLNVRSGIVGISPGGATIELRRVFPKTINASVEQSSNVSTGNSTTQSNQTSIGSSTSNVNTFGIDLSAGWFVDGPIASVGVNHSHSRENSISRMSGVLQSSASDHQASLGDVMSVKDWSAYSAIHYTGVNNPNGNADEYVGEFVEWNWGQSYPWNVFDFNQIGSGSNILMPQSVASNLLFNGSGNQGQSSSILLPPSDLSIHGLDFTMASEWLIKFAAPLKSPEQLKFRHKVGVTHASHSKSGSADGQITLVASLATAVEADLKQDNPMTLSQYALVPLSSTQSAGISFQSGLFDITPSVENKEFQIRSRGNNLLVTGTGFTSAMIAQFPENYNGPGASLTIAFKVADINTQYTLIMKHWIGQRSGAIVLTFDVNGNKTKITLYGTEGQGASNNTSELDLRNFDLKSANFHDYLVLGWNAISVNIKPVELSNNSSSARSEYVLLALSVEG